MKHEILLSCPPIIRDFLTYNETIKGKSSKSVDEYYLDLQTFFRYLLLVRGKVDKKSNFEEIDIRIKMHLNSLFLVNIDCYNILDYDEVYYYDGKFYGTYLENTDSDIIYKKTEKIIKDGIKYDKDGSLVYESTYRVLDNSKFTSIALVEDGYVVCGQSIYDNMMVGLSKDGGSIIVNMKISNIYKFFFIYHTPLSYVNYNITLFLCKEKELTIFS